MSTRIPIQAHVRAAILIGNGNLSLRVLRVLDAYFAKKK